MRIALTIHALFGGGAERLMSQLANRWSHLGHEVHLLTWAAVSSDRLPLSSNIVRHGLNLLEPSRSKLHGLLANLRRVRKLRSALQEIKPDLVLSFCDQMNIVTLQASNKLRVPVWISEHSDPSKQKLSALWEFWRNRAYPKCTGSIVLTQQIKEHFRRWLPAERIHVIYNAISPPANQLQTPHVGTTSLNDSLSTLLTMGRLSYEKGFDILLDAWRQVENQLPSWQLKIVGDGNQRAALEHQASDLHQVHFVGWVDDPWPMYSKAQAFILPSRYEGFPVALVEAMSQGLPCIATHCTEAIELLSDGDKALMVVPTNSSDELAQALLRLANQPELQSSLGESAKRISQKFTWEIIGPQWDNLVLHTKT